MRRWQPPSPYCLCKPARPLRKLAPRPDRPLAPALVERVCASLRKCARVCASVRECARVCASVRECARVCAVAGLPFVRADPRGCADAPDVAAAGRLGAAACCGLVASWLRHGCVMVASWLRLGCNVLRRGCNGITNVCGCKSVGVRGGVRIAQQRGAWRARTAGLVAAAWPRAAAVA